MPTITKHAGEWVTVNTRLKNTGVDLNYFYIQFKLVSPSNYYVVAVSTPPISLFRSGETINWMGDFQIFPLWLSGDYKLIFMLFDKNGKFQETETDWIIKIIT
jgi:hypothetical protein